MRALVVGAGAVGQTYGWHLKRGGAEITFYVTPSHLDAMAGGLWLHPLGKPPAHWEDFDRVTDADAVASAGPFDQVWICTSSTALRAGDWLGPLLAAAGPDALVVTLQPGATDRGFVESLSAPERVVSGLIGLVAFQAPLPGETLEHPGVAFWLPPLTRSPMSGPRAAEAVRALRAGGFPAVVGRDVPGRLAAAGAVMQPFIGALELGGWTFKGFRKKTNGLAARAAREAMRINAPGRALGRAVMRAPVLWLVSLIAPRVVPFDLETYLRYHFTKVGDQTRVHLRSYVERAGDHPTPVLRAMCDRLGDA